jgi:hypothetical protein
VGCGRVSWQRAPPHIALASLVRTPIYSGEGCQLSSPGASQICTSSTTTLLQENGATAVIDLGLVTLLVVGVGIAGVWHSRMDQRRAEMVVDSDPRACGLCDSRRRLNWPHIPAQCGVDAGRLRVLVWPPSGGACLALTRESRAGMSSLQPLFCRSAPTHQRPPCASTIRRLSVGARHASPCLPCINARLAYPPHREPMVGQGDARPAAPLE